MTGAGGSSGGAEIDLCFPWLLPESIVKCREPARGSGPQIEGGAQGAIHVERDRGVLVDDLPGASLSLEAEGFAHPEIDFPFGALLGAGHAKEAVAEGEAAADRDFEVMGFEIEWASVIWPSASCSR